MTMRITGGSLRGRRIRVASSTRLRPTSDRVRGAVFSILGMQACAGARVLDLYAGTGMLGVEALSRGASSSVFVESDGRLARRMRENLRDISMEEQTKVIRARVERVLDSLEGAFDLVFADPPYGAQVWSDLMGRLGRGDLLSERGVVVVEYRHGTSLADDYGVLTKQTSRRYGDSVIGVYRSEGR